MILFFFFLFFLQLVGLALLAVGIWGIFELKYYLELSDTDYSNVEYVLIGTGSFMIAAGIIGCCATCKNIAWLLQLVSKMKPSLSQSIMPVGWQTYQNHSPEWWSNCTQRVKMHSHLNCWQVLLTFQNVSKRFKTFKHRERHANLPAIMASKWVTQQYKFMMNVRAEEWFRGRRCWIFLLLTCKIRLLKQICPL